MVASWGNNADVIDAEKLIDIGSREPVVAMVMGCTHRKQDSALELSASYGSQVCINMEIPEIVALRDRLVGSAWPVELIMERGKRFEQTEVQVVTVPELYAMNPHVALGKRFRCKVLIEGLQRNKKWYYHACDGCGCKSVEEGAMYRCSSEKCGNRGASPRFCIPVIASGDGASVQICFFGDVGRDLIGKPADALVIENCGLFSAVPPEIAALAGRRYVVDVSVSKYSFRSQDIRFQVHKFYPEGSSVFVGLNSSMAGAASTMNVVAGGPSSQQHAAGFEEHTDATVVSIPDAGIGHSTPPPSAVSETPTNKPTAGTDEDSHSLLTASDESLDARVEKRDSNAKRELVYSETSEKTGKKAARKK